MPATAAAGHVRITPPAPTPATVDVVHNGDTKLRVHVTDASKPFWLVLGESNSPGWHAHVVNGHDLGPSQLVDGYANGWLVTPPPRDRSTSCSSGRRNGRCAPRSGSRCSACCCASGSSRSRGRGGVSVIATADTPLPATPTSTRVERRLAAAADRHAFRWLAPLVTGLLAALVVAPWVGVLTALIVFAFVVRPRLRPWLLAVPAALLAPVRRSTSSSSRPATGTRRCSSGPPSSRTPARSPGSPSSSSPPTPSSRYLRSRTRSRNAGPGSDAGQS